MSLLRSPASLLFAAAALSLALLVAEGALGITLDQQDDFETDTAEGWSSGFSDVPVDPDGGPLGEGDAHLVPQAFGGAQAGSRLTIFNDSHWTGDYPAAGVGAIALDVLHVAGSDVSLRLSLTAESGTVASAVPMVVSPPAVWETIELSLDPADLLFLGGSGDIASVLAGAVHLRIFHSSDTPVLGQGGFARGGTITATIGIDNVTALPEPSGPLAATVCLAATVWLARGPAARPR